MFAEMRGLRSLLECGCGVVKKLVKEQIQHFLFQTARSCLDFPQILQASVNEEMIKSLIKSINTTRNRI